MSSKDEALKMAIETLEKHGFMEDSTFDDVVKACKEALEQPAYETESWKNNMKESEKILAKAKFANEQPAQEPVAWIYEWEDEKAAKLTFYPDSKAKVIPLYTHPAPSWQGLSVDERYSIIKELSGYDFDADNYDVAVFVEQALRDKNE